MHYLSSVKKDWLWLMALFDFFRGHAQDLIPKTVPKWIPYCCPYLGMLGLIWISTLWKMTSLWQMRNKAFIAKVLLSLLPNNSKQFE